MLDGHGRIIVASRALEVLLEDIRDTGRFDRAIAAQRAGVREAMACR